jgi:hypothetical protein
VAKNGVVFRCESFPRLVLVHAQWYRQERGTIGGTGTGTGRRYGTIQDGDRTYNSWAVSDSCSARGLDVGLQFGVDFTTLDTTRNAGTYT